ncbi:MAG: hypothetical protein IKP69_12100 [Oscillospiraceae bacterium]|nr:hypothetical protein [Oscillospiraceae bacterium]
MNISQNIQWILDRNTKWEPFTNKSYQVQIQKANSGKIYNVPGQKGVVYNILEDAYEKTGDTGYIITGVASEMWVIPPKALQKYDIMEHDITDEPQSVMTKETGTIFAAVQIPVDKEFTLEVDYGEKVILKGNRPEIGHNTGDYVLVATKKMNGQYVPDFEDSGRIVNGAVFQTLYQPCSAEK